MKIFRVTVSDESHYYKDIEAEDEESAQELAESENWTDETNGWTFDMGEGEAHIVSIVERKD